jgi:hypothetical protein
MNLKTKNIRDESYPKILIIAVYFGKLPDYFELWLTSCSYNPDFYWLLITDQKVVECDVPCNVNIVNLSISDFSDKISEELGFEISLVNPYKCCDYRPLYHIFTKLVKGNWDFWGHCDLDMLFGNLKKFITKDILNNYDKIFSVGHLTIYRNNDYVNNLYKIPFNNLDYKKIFASSDNYGFDEHNGINEIWIGTKGKYYQDESIIIDIDPYLRNFQRIGSKKIHKNYIWQTFYFNKGIIYHVYWRFAKIHYVEFMYIHFQKRIISTKFISKKNKSFYISSLGFISVDEIGELTRKKIDKLNNVRLPTFDEIEYKIKRLVRITFR